MADLKISALPASTTPLAGTETLPIVQSSTTKQVSVANLTAGRTVGTGALNTTGKITVNLDGAVGMRLNNTTGGAGQGIEMLTATTKYSWLLGAQYNVNDGFEITPSTAVGGTSWTTPAFKLEYAGGGVFNASIGTGNLAFSTAAKGINFTANTPAAGMTSQLLNWYEEGIWTTGMTADGGTVTLSFDKLNYTRSGRIVTISGEIVVSAISAPTGDIYISLPFTNSASTSGRSGIWSSYLGVAYTFTGVPLGPMVGLMNGGATKMTIRVGNNAGGTAASGFLAVGTTFDLGFTYQCQ